MSTINVPDTEPTFTPAFVIGKLFENVGVSATGNLDDALNGTHPFYVWRGHTPMDDDGAYWIPALFPCSRLPEALVRVQNARRERGKAHDEGTCRRLMAAFHSGLGKRFVAKCPFAFVEIDHLPRAEQEARYEELTEATGLQWCLQVFSGGKSIHAYLAFSEALEATDPLREHIQKLLVVILEGDTRITDPGRLMRLPGWNGPKRKQPVVHFDSDARFPALEVRDRLQAYAASKGILDVDVAFRTLQLTEALDVQAKHDAEDSDTEAANEIREHAEFLRRTRGNPAEEDVRLARAMLGKGVRATMAAASTTTPHPHCTGSTVYLSALEMASYANLPKFTTVHPPCCADNPKLKGTVLSEPNSPWGPTVWCHKHDTRFVVGAGVGNQDVEKVDIDALINTDDLYVEQIDEEIEEVSDLAEVDSRVEDLEKASWRKHFVEIHSSSERLSKALEEDLNGSTDVIPDFGSATLLDIYKSVAEPKSSEVKVAPLEVNLHVEEALERFLALDGEGSWCRRGPSIHSSKGDGTRATERLLACKSYRCSSCGPWKITWLRAAAWVAVRRHTQEGEWHGLRVVVPTKDKPAHHELQRWHVQDSRVFIGCAINPDQVEYLVFWKGAEAVSGLAGAVHRHLTRLGAVKVTVPLHEAVDTIVAGIDLTAWKDADRAVILRGCSALKSKVSNLHDRGLGRSKATGSSSGTSFSVRTYTRQKEVRDEVSRRVLAMTIEEGVDLNGRERSRSTSWRVADDMPVRLVLEQMAGEGFFQPIRRHKKAECDEEIVFEWLSLSS